MDFSHFAALSVCGVLVPPVFLRVWRIRCLFHDAPEQPVQRVGG